MKLRTLKITKKIDKKNVCVYLSYLINFQLLLQVWRFVYDFKAFYSFRVQAILYRFRVTAGKLNDIILLKVNILWSYIVLFDMRKKPCVFYEPQFGQISLDISFSDSVLRLRNSGNMLD